MVQAMSFERASFQAEPWKVERQESGSTETMEGRGSSERRMWLAPFVTLVLEMAKLLPKFCLSLKEHMEGETG